MGLTRAVPTSLLLDQPGLFQDQLVSYYIFRWAGAPSGQLRDVVWLVGPEIHAPARGWADSAGSAQGTR